MFDNWFNFSSDQLSFDYYFYFQARHMLSLNIITTFTSSHYYFYTSFSIASPFLVMCKCTCQSIMQKYLLACTALLFSDRETYESTSTFYYTKKSSCQPSFKILCSCSFSHFSQLNLPQDKNIKPGFNLWWGDITYVHV